ncbi:MAG TPA: HNH endonuclease signature motif containing protein [Polyangiaceae bacterium]
MDVHHVETRADGGGHDQNNLITICAAHHRAVHEGTLTITGSATQGVSVRHADGTPYGTLPSASSSLVQARAFRALRELGFGERDTRRALTEVLEELEHDAELETVLRDCLRLLTERAWTKAS